MTVKRLFIFIFLLALCVHFPDQFSERFLVHNIPNQYTPFECENLEEILSEPLHYCGSGLQAVAFSTHDDKYVIKFFLKRKIRKKMRIRLPKLYPKEPLNKKYQRMDILARYNEAFLKLKEETGLVAVHLGATKQKLPKCKLIDHRGKMHKINLRKVSFVIQKKAQGIRDAMKINREKKIASLETLLKKIASKGFLNMAKKFNVENFAFVGDEAIMIDLGRIAYHKEVEKDPTLEIARLEKSLKNWAGTI